MTTKMYKELLSLLIAAALGVPSLAGCNPPAVEPQTDKETPGDVTPGPDTPDTPPTPEIPVAPPSAMPSGTSMSPRRPRPPWRGRRTTNCFAAAGPMPEQPSSARNPAGTEASPGGKCAATASLPPISTRMTPSSSPSLPSAWPPAPRWISPAPSMPRRRMHRCTGFSSTRMETTGNQWRMISIRSPDRTRSIRSP